MASRSKDGWIDMPEAQPRLCSCGRKVILAKGSTWFKTAPPLSTTCKECMTKTLLLSYCGCDYCLLASDAIQDARDAHRRAA